MNVGFIEKQTLAEVNGCKLVAEVDANHYFHYDSIKGAQWNELSRYGVLRYVMTGPTGTHTLDKEHTPWKRLKAHWAGFCGNAEARIKRVNRLPKRWWEK